MSGTAKLLFETNVREVRQCREPFAVVLIRCDQFSLSYFESADHAINRVALRLKIHARGKTYITEQELNQPEILQRS